MATFPCSRRLSPVARAVRFPGGGGLPGDARLTVVYDRSCVFRPVLQLGSAIAAQFPSTPRPPLQPPPAAAGAAEGWRSGPLSRLATRAEARA